MTITPLFFLPRAARIWAYHQAIAEHLMDTPFMLLFVSFDRLGIEFWYRGDTVIWTWPWTRKGRAPFISLGFTGNGMFGDARYWTLKEMDNEWQMYFEACCPKEDATEKTIKPIETFDATIELFNQPRPDGAIGRVV